MHPLRIRSVCSPFFLRNPVRKINGLETDRIRNASWKHPIRQFDGRGLFICQSFYFATKYLDIHYETINDWGTFTIFYFPVFIFFITTYDRIELNLKKKYLNYLYENTVKSTNV